jgi:hypothetical protein
MHQGKLVFSKVTAHLPLSTFRHCVSTHRGEHKPESVTWQSKNPRFSIEINDLDHIFCFPQQAKIP